MGKSIASGGITNLPLLIQNFTTIGDIGDASQINAGHIYASDILGAGTDVAYYKFANGALTTDEEELTLSQLQIILVGQRSPYLNIKYKWLSVLSWRMYAKI